MFSLVCVCVWGGGGGMGEGLEPQRVISESEHQKGRVIPPCKLFKGRVQIFLVRIFVTFFFPFF